MSETDAAGQADAAGQVESPLSAIPEMRSAAKWNIAAFGAVGAALIIVLPLARLHELVSNNAIWLVVLGFAIGIGGVMWAIGKTAEALTPSVTTLSSVTSDELKSLKTLIDTSPEAFYGSFGTSVHDLIEGRRLHERAAVNIAKQIAIEQDPAVRRLLKQALAEQMGNASLARTLQRQLLEFAHAWQVREALLKARRNTIGAVVAIFVGVALIMIASAELPAEEEEEEAPSETSDQSIITGRADSMLWESDLDETNL